ncbi:hypothetical protein E3N88_20922 [Mikania micrantha]|uniref:Uncharacterized protein n=1 Tax=Mikania micrantha TaxID=192012 RepID=A0A5N6NJT4_9ASTR|nr:hypothetical protein E3N88_20922 [Mikania micrantha]
MRLRVLGFRQTKGMRLRRWSRLSRAEYHHRGSRVSSDEGMRRFRRRDANSQLLWSRWWTKTAVVAVEDEGGGGRGGGRRRRWSRWWTKATVVGRDLVDREVKEKGRSADETWEEAIRHKKSLIHVCAKKRILWVTTIRFSFCTFLNVAK